MHAFPLVIARYVIPKVLLITRMYRIEGGLNKLSIRKYLSSSPAIFSVLPIRSIISNPIRYICLRNYIREASRKNLFMLVLRVFIFIYEVILSDNVSSVTIVELYPST